MDIETSHTEPDLPYKRFYISNRMAEDRNVEMVYLLLPRISKRAMDNLMDYYFWEVDFDVNGYAKAISETEGEPESFLPAHTPLKEAIFRALLLNWNAPMTAVEISKYLSTLWVMSPFPRDMSPDMIDRMLRTSGNLFITEADGSSYNDIPAISLLLSSPGTATAVTSE